MAAPKLKLLAMSNVMYIGFPEATLKSTAEPKSATVKKVLWGDWAEVVDTDGEFRKIHCRNAVGWVHHTKLQTDRILEINFIDVGQGDGCFIVTPQDEFILVDAGVADNMYRFLKWRFNLDHNQFRVPIKHLIISHPDEDHYNGFKYIVNSPRFSIENIYHNGIIERTGKNLGPVDASGLYLTDLYATHQQAKDLVENAAMRGSKQYPNLLFNALKMQPQPHISMLEKGGEIAGYGKQDKVQFKILGPVTEQVDGKKALRYFNKNDGEAKNGHSVIVQLIMGKVKILLGGDLNDASEEYLAEHYTGYNPKKITTEAEREDMISKGREVFESDVLKSCHHGSHKFIDDFLSFFNPVATVISSGDNESHTHPRPDTLGAIGKHSRGKRPLIFSTELARSAKEKLTVNDKDIAELYKLIEERKVAADDDKPGLDKKIAAIKYNMERVIAVYGMINVRTDGEKVIIAQKKEERGGGFIIYELHPGLDGKLFYKKS
ncbi:ComEC/Rec2 family competence protein [Mucilaginibacter terrae]|uniref:ComEC/Rec2 family competence protein n=1 Tax=Mucilaginibacter terrae TaxID=1955052 RepID=UPI003629F2C1